MKIRINKIFGKYDNEIDFSKNINIFIGENGIGKTTCIKILNCLLNFDYIGLLNYYFESIEIIEESEKIIVKYEDIAILKDYQFKKFCNGNQDLFEECRVLNELLDYRLLYKILKNNDKILTNERLITKIDSSGVYVDFIRNLYKHEEKNQIDGIYYLNSKIEKKHNVIKTLFKNINYRQVLLINMANDFKTINDLDRIYGINPLEKNAKSDELQKMEKKNMEMQKEHNFSFLHFRVFIENPCKKYPNLSNPEFINNLKQNYKVIRKDGLKNNTIDFGHYLFNKIYTDELIKEFKNDLYDYLYNNIKNVSKEIDEYQIKDKTYNILKIYLKPLLDNQNIFSQIIHEWNDYTYGQDWELLINFYKKYKNKYFEIKNEKLSILNQLFKKYFTNKEIIATPFGISISSTQDYNNDIYFEELSAGEQKIIILLTISVFSDGLIILLDEPETSLSVVWQKELLMDIVSNSKLKNLIVATQSPYIVSNNELLEYLVLLPMEEKNE